MEDLAVINSRRLDRLERRLTRMEGIAWAVLLIMATRTGYEIIPSVLASMG